MAPRSQRMAQLRQGLHAIGTAEGRAPLVDRLVAETQKLVEQQLRRGIAPGGEPLVPLKRSQRTPLYGRGRLLGDVTAAADGERIAVEFPHIPDALLRAHQDGATIPTRRVAAGERVAAPKSGRFLSRGQARRRKLVFVVPIPAHDRRAWTLPRRPVLPDDAMPQRWADRLNAAAVSYMRATFPGAT